MKIKIIQECTGFPDGVTARKYPSGVKLVSPRDLPDDLAATFVAQGWAERIQEAETPETPENPKGKRTAK